MGLVQEKYEVFREEIIQAREKGGNVDKCKRNSKDHGSVVEVQFYHIFSKIQITLPSIFIGATVLYSPFYFHWLSIFHLTMTTPHLLLIFHLTMTTLNNKQFLYVLVKQVLDSTENFCLLTSIILQKRARKTPIENFFQPRA